MAPLASQAAAAAASAASRCSRQRWRAAATQAASSAWPLKSRPPSSSSPPAVSSLAIRARVGARSVCTPGASCSQAPLATSLTPSSRRSLNRRWRRLVSAFLCSASGHSSAVAWSAATGPSSATKASKAASLGDSGRLAGGCVRSSPGRPSRRKRQPSVSVASGSEVWAAAGIVDASSAAACPATAAGASAEALRLCCRGRRVTSGLPGRLQGPAGDNRHREASQTAAGASVETRHWRKVRTAQGGVAANGCPP